MRHLCHRVLVMVFAVFLCSGVLYAQVTAVRVNNQKTGAVIVQGDTLRWTITLPTGATSMNELWVDGNANGGADAGVDKLLFAFPQTDGAMGTEGPGDMDGAANGTILTQLKNGLAPAAYVFIAKHNNVADTASFTVTPLPSPAYTVSGRLTVPQGVSPRWFLIEADPNGETADMVFWQALTDANGNYTINFDTAAASYNPWRVRVDLQGTGPFIATRRDTIITLAGHHTGVDFVLIRGTVITGTVKDQNNNPVPTANPHLHDPYDQNKQLDFSYGNVDQNGGYAIVAPDGKYFMHFTAPGYKDQWWNSKNSFMTADTIFITSSSPDTIKNINGVVQLAALIRGTVTVNGNPAFAGVNALLTTPPYNYVASTGTNERGEYDLTVDPGTYYIEFRTGNQFQYAQYYNNKTSLPADAVTVTLGQTVSNINANFVITSVEENRQVPTTLMLYQNYPNPFNPSTSIRFDLPMRSSVRLSVYNLLGQEVLRLVDNEMEAGVHTVSVDASRLASGMYIYRLMAAGVTISKKMSVMK